VDGFNCGFAVLLGIPGRTTGLFAALGALGGVLALVRPPGDPGAPGLFIAPAFPIGGRCCGCCGKRCGSPTS